jgi:TonB family protein
VGTGANTPIPKPAGSSVQAAIEELSRAGGGGHGLVIGDLEGKGGIFEARELPSSRDGSASNLEMLSDPKGVDFRPYLIQVLSSVRRNWHAVMPASARLGRRGKVVIQFAIDRSGGVPKLVIAVPSGAEPLDRAAVAAISASNPFPPLPAEYTANDVRLQLNFLYNLK